jgi:tRNA (guanosine-2'-O-)-methyltransferase
MTEDLKKELVSYLRDFTTESRWDTINEVLSKRTDHLTVVLEDLHKPHNANAVLRSCDGFGIQDVYIIENKNEFDTEGTVSIGAHQWLTLNRYNKPENDNIRSCFDDLRAKGYKIIATTPHENDSNLNELPVDDKIALVFGTELNGISEEVKEQADGFVKIPMYGFSESFNISVSAAVCLYDLTTRIRNTNLEWGLAESYKTDLQLKWLKKTIKAGDRLVQKFLADQ